MFFRVVEGNLSHHTLLGEQPVSFDFVASELCVVDASMGNDPTLIVTVGSATEPTLVVCTIMDLPFEVLSSSLCVWHDSEVNYHVKCPMQLCSKFSSKYVFLLLSKRNPLPT